VAKNDGVQDWPALFTVQESRLEAGVIWPAPTTAWST